MRHERVLRERRGDGLHPTATRAADDVRHVVGDGLEGDSRRAFRPGRAILARTDPIRAPRLLRSLRPGGRPAGHRRRDQRFRRAQVASSRRGHPRTVGGARRLVLAGHDGAVLVYVISAWAIFTGLLKVLIAVAFRREIENGWPMILGGLLSVLFGIILGAMPGAGLVTLVWLVGIYAQILGVALVVLGFLDRATPRQT